MRNRWGVLCELGLRLAICASALVFIAVPASADSANAPFANDIWRLYATGSTAISLGRDADADAAFRQAITIIERRGDNRGDLRVFWVADMLALMSLERYADAERTQSRVVDIDAQDAKTEHSSIGSDKILLGTLQWQQKHCADAEKTFRQVYTDARFTLLAEPLLAQVIADQGRYTQAESLMSDVVERWQRDGNDVQSWFQAYRGIWRSAHLGRYEEGYRDLKHAASSVWAMTHDLERNPSPDQALKHIKVSRWIFEGQFNSAWTWGHAP